MIRQLFTVFTLFAALDKSLEEGSLPLRPQEPKNALFYDAEEVKYSNATANVTLAGTLTFPRTEKPSPAVLLIAGSGRIDRNETVCGHKPFLVLADHLTKQGFVVLRADKRGIGESTGNYDVATSEDFAADALAGVEYLKTRKEVDAKRIGLIGHSEGGLIAPMVAIQSNDVAFIVRMAGPCVTGEAIVYAQEALISRGMGITEEQLSHQLAFQREVFSIIKNEPDLEKAEKQLRKIIAKQLANLPKEERQTSADAMEAQMKRCNSRWFRYYLTCDPMASLQHLKIPILVINGELDSQVIPQQNLPVITKILAEAGNQNYRIIEFPKLNHFFQTCETGSVLEYGKIEETIAPVVLDTISDWILEATKSEEIASRLVECFKFDRKTSNSIMHWLKPLLNKEKYHSVLDGFMEKIANLDVQFTDTSISPLFPNDAVLKAPKSHQILFENAHIRILRTVVKCGESVPFHTHQWDHLTIVTQGGQFKSEDLQGIIEFDDIPIGVYELRGEERAWTSINVGDTTFEALVFEIKK